MSSKYMKIAIAAFISLLCCMCIAGRPLTAEEIIAHHFKLTEDFAETLRNLTSQVTSILHCF